MKLQYLRAFIVLLAALITLMVNIKTKKDVIVSLLTVLLVILIFYVLASLVTEIVQKYLEPKEKEEGQDSDEDSELEKADFQSGEVEKNEGDNGMVQIPFEEE